MTKQRRSQKAADAVAPTPATGSLSSRALLVAFTCHWWDGVTMDQKITGETNNKYQSEGRYNKRLVPLKDLLPMRSARIAAQKIHKTYTLAWSDDGWRCLSSAAYFEYDRDLRAAIDLAEKEYDTFAKRYKDILEDKAKTDKSFNPKHYPTVGEIRNKYGFHRYFKPVPVSSDLRVELSDDALAAVRASIDEDQQARIKVATFDIAARIKETVGYMVQRLRDYVPATKNDKASNTFHDSLITNVRELCDLLPKINITGDSRIETMAADLTKILPEKIDTLRDNEKVRLSTADAADKILQRVSDFI